MLSVHPTMADACWKAAHAATVGFEYPNSIVASQATAGLGNAGASVTPSAAVAA